MNNNSIIDGKIMAACVKAGAARLEKNEALVNQLNVFPVPDGDTGSNMLTTLKGGMQSAKNTSHLGEYMTTLARGMLFGARGNSGVIFSQIFSGIAEVLKDKETATAAELLEAFSNGSRVAYSSVVVPTEGTILTVVREGAEKIDENMLGNISVWDFFRSYIENIRTSLEKTPDLLPILKSAGVVDSGGYGFVKFFEGFTQSAIEGILADDNDPIASINMQVSAKWLEDAQEDAFGFCTECIIILNDSKKLIKDEVVSYLESMGQSVVCVQSGEILKLHVHTLEPIKVLSHMQEYGTFFNVKIENMDNQFTNRKESASYEYAEDIDATMKKAHEQMVKEIHHGIAYVAVANGDGIIESFKNLGCDIVLNGGQTMNTSVEEFVDAFEEVDCDSIIVMPNNSNIEAAAKQAAKLFGEDRVFVLSTKSVAEGYFAMSMALTDKGEATDIVEQMKRGIKGVDTVFVSKAIRDARVSDVECHEGDYLALIGKEIVATDTDRLEAVKKVLASVENIDDKYVLLIFKGQCVSDEECEELQEYIEDNYDWLDVGIIDGGQEVYDYVIGISE